MAKVLVTYYSRSGNTRRMAEKVREGLASVNGVEVTLKQDCSFWAKFFPDSITDSLSQPLFGCSQNVSCRKLGYSLPK